MLTDELAKEIFANEHCNISKELAGILARAIEAAVLPEGWVAVPRIVTPAIEAVYSNDSGAYGTAQELHDAMIAAAPKPAQAECAVPEVIGLYEKALKASWPNGATGEAFDYWNKARYLLAATTQLAPKAQAEKQGGGITFEEYVKRKPHLYGPVKDEPDFFVVVEETGAPEFIALWPEFCHEHINRAISEFDIEGAAKWKVVPLYTRPQPDLTAEVERLELSLEKACRRAEYWKAEHLAGNIRIAALEEAAREAREKQ